MGAWILKRFFHCILYQRFSFSFPFCLLKHNTHIFRFPFLSTCSTNLNQNNINKSILKHTHTPKPSSFSLSFECIVFMFMYLAIAYSLPLSNIFNSLKSIAVAFFMFIKTKFSRKKRENDSVWKVFLLLLRQVRASDIFHTRIVDSQRNYSADTQEHSRASLPFSSCSIWRGFVDDENMIF